MSKRNIDGSETFAMSEFRITIESPSAFREGELATQNIGWSCPKCNYENRHFSPSHFDRFECQNCRVKASLHGNALRLFPSVAKRVRDRILGR